MRRVSSKAPRPGLTPLGQDDGDFAILPTDQCMASLLSLYSPWDSHFQNARTAVFDRPHQPGYVEPPARAFGSPGASRNRSPAAVKPALQCFGQAQKGCPSPWLHYVCPEYVCRHAGRDQIVTDRRHLASIYVILSHVGVERQCISC